MPYSCVTCYHDLDVLAKWQLKTAFLLRRCFAGHSLVITLNNKLVWRIFAFFM